MKRYLFIAIMALSCNLPKPALKTTEVTQWASIFEKYDRKGVFLLCDIENNCKSNQSKQVNTPFIAASTFKIPNSLIALEEKVLRDELETWKWDGTERGILSWNADTNLKDGFKNSTVWFYQEIAKKVGIQKYNAYLKAFNYGNKNTNGGLTLFWLTGDLHITPMQQITFLQRFYNNDLPVSSGTLQKVKSIMLREEIGNAKLYAKTGWGQPKGEDSEQYGWFVGWVEKDGKPYFFAICLIQSPPMPTDFGKSRIDISKEILSLEGIL